MTATQTYAQMVEHVLMWSMATGATVMQDLREGTVLLVSLFLLITTNSVC